ncbi:MAG: nucleotide-binding protein [Methanomicrobiales archaeon]|nr:nucleotide-binding protein [Methanomicrobiales archaeon]
MATDRDGYSDRVEVLLDTNALIIPYQLGIDIYAALGELLGSYEPLVLEDTVAELRGIARRGGREGVAARMGLAMAERARVVSGTSGDSVDERIIHFAEERRCTVLTNDAALRRALKRRGINVISVRKLRKLEIFR